jgi:MFS family permease
MTLATNNPRGFLPAFVTLNALAGTSVGLAKVATSLFSLQLKPTPLELSLIAGAQSLGVLFMSLPLGVLLDQFGPLPLFVVGSILAGLFFLLTPWVTHPLLLALIIACASFCLPGRFVSMNAVFMQQLARIGHAKAGWLRGSHMIGFFLLGPGLAVSLVGALRFGGAFAFIGLSFFLSTALAPLVMRHYDASQAPADRRLNVASLIRQFRIWIGDDELRRIGGIEFCCQAVNQFYVFFIVVIAVRNFGFSAGEAAGLVSCQGAAYVLALFSMGHLAVRLGEHRFYLMGFAGAIAALLMLGLSHRPASLWSGAVVLGTALGMLQTVNIARFAEAGRRVGRSGVASFITFISPLGGLAGSLLGGLVGRVFSLQFFFILMTPVFLAFAIRRGITLGRGRSALALAEAK